MLIGDDLAYTRLYIYPGELLVHIDMTTFRILLHICLSTAPIECMAGWQSGDCGVTVNQKCVAAYFVLKSVSNQLPFFCWRLRAFQAPTRESQLNHAKPISTWIDTCPRSLYKSTRNVKKWMSIQGNGWAPHLVHFPWCMTHGMLGGAPAPPWPWVTRAGVGNGWIICVPVIDGMG